MQFRTDLALEMAESLPTSPPGISTHRWQQGEACITRIQVENEEGAKALGRPVGRYVTVELPPFSDDPNWDEDCTGAVAEAFGELLPPKGTVLVVGLGNQDITPDALGPKTVDRILVTRHISGELARSVGLGELRSVTALAPGVLGQTGMESAEIVKALVERIAPSAVVAIDALASRELSRLGRTVQLSDTGIQPGAGVGNARKELSREKLGVPVIAMGVPTVVDAVTLARDLLPEGEEMLRRKEFEFSAPMMVTPREIDLVIQRSSAFLALAINRTLQPHLSTREILEMLA